MSALSLHSESPPQVSPQRKYALEAEAILAERIPEYQPIMSEAGLKDFLTLFGATDETLLDRIRLLDEAMMSRVDRFRAVGVSLES